MQATLPYLFIDDWSIGRPTGHFRHPPRSPEGGENPRIL